MSENTQPKHPVIELLARYAPNVPGAILHRQVLSPLDLERLLGLTGGNIMQGAMGLNSLFSLRPVASVTMHTVGGSVQADMVHVDSIRIAGAEVRNSLVAIHDLPDAPPDIDGLLGLSVLGQFDVTLDATRSRLYLGQPNP